MNRTSLYLSQPGVICGAGSDISRLWISAIEGSQKGIQQLSCPDGRKIYAAGTGDTALKKTRARYDTRSVMMENAAITQLSIRIEQVRQLYGEDRIAVCTGTGNENADIAAYTSTFIAEKYGLSGPVFTCTAAQPFAAGPFIKAAEMIRDGLADAVIAGGTGSVEDTLRMEEEANETVSRGITNPFSKNRDGFTPGEGAAFFIVTREPLEENHIRLLGSGCDSGTADFSAAMTAALKDGNLKPENIDYINLHGTGTIFNDSMESKAIDSVFGTYKVPASTTKPLTGYVCGACSAIELAICYAAVIQNRNKIPEHIRLPVQIWDHQTDCSLPELNFVQETTIPRSGRTAVCMCNTCIPGKSCITLIIGTDGENAG